MDPVKPLMDLMAALRKQVGHMPVGPERARKLRELAEEARTRATTSNERRFWDGFLSRV